MQKIMIIEDDPKIAEHLHSSITVLGVFLAIQMVYFFIVRFFYTKQIEKAIQ